MENENNLAVGFKNIAKWVGIVLVFLVFAVWVVLWARFSANYTWVMPLREYYLDKIVTRRALPDSLPHTIQPKQKASGGYWYEMWGKIVRLDYVNYMMILRDARGVEWNVRLVQAPYYQRNRIGIKIHEFTINRESGMGMGGRAVPLTIDRRAPELTEPYLQAGDMISAVWNDPLVLSEIYLRNRRGEYTVELTGEIPRPIRKVVGK